MATTYAGVCLLTFLVAFSAQLDGALGELRSSPPRFGNLNPLKPIVISRNIEEENEIDESAYYNGGGAQVASTPIEVLVPEGERSKKDQRKEFKGEIWAVLVAGSNGYFNYRHQADVCHAYQILRQNGVPAENIITMMYDDVANSTDNPTPGILINRPEGPDVYEGVVKDYVGEDVTPDTFIKVLLGDQEALEGVGSGRALKSGPDDHVFINFVDHGAPGLVAFPDSELHASKFKEVLRQMHRRRMYSKLVLYVEACESGSMFENLLPVHWNIFATTAANAEESSYACYFDDLRQTYLGDVYSVRWMENAETVDLTTETLEEQFLIVKNETNSSHVQDFGDGRLRSLPVSEFLGLSDPDKLMASPLVPVELDAAKVVDVPTNILQRRIEKEADPRKRAQVEEQLAELLEKRAVATKNMMDILEAVIGNDEKAGEEREIILGNRFKLIDFNCYEQAARFYSKRCYSIAKNSFVASQLYKIVNLCERGWPLEKIIDAMARTCKNTWDVVGIQ